MMGDPCHEQGPEVHIENAWVVVVVVVVNVARASFHHKPLEGHVDNIQALALGMVDMG